MQELRAQARESGAAAAAECVLHLRSDGIAQS